MPKFTLLGTFSHDGLSQALPPEYRDLAVTLTQDCVLYSVVQFAHDRADVVTSAAVRRALVEIPPTQLVLAIGGNFTVEAAGLLELRNAVIARLGHLHWTDESYHSRRQ